MNKLTINPSIASHVDIDPVGYNELVKIYFKANENWEGNLQFKLWNSAHKNAQTTIALNPLLLEGDLMTLTIEPKEQQLEAVKYYYEIVETISKRIYFKGILNIKK